MRLQALHSLSYSISVYKVFKLRMKEESSVVLQFMIAARFTMNCIAYFQGHAINNKRFFIKQYLLFIS